MVTWIVSPDMSSALVGEVFSFLRERAFTGISERSKKASKQTESVVGVSSKQEFASHFNIFCEQLPDVLKSVCSRSKWKSGTLGIDRASLWRTFHLCRLNKLEDIWRNFLQAVNEELDPIIGQYANEKIFQSVVLSQYGPPAAATARRAIKTVEEANIVRSHFH